MEIVLDISFVPGFATDTGSGWDKPPFLKLNLRIQIADAFPCLAERQLATDLWNSSGEQTALLSAVVEAHEITYVALHKDADL